jgi:glycosyltransferase involved in cell wall biosynthesis
VLVLPSAHEELGSVLIEAMAAGLPAVAYDAGGPSEVIEPEITGLLVGAGDVEAMATAVARVLDDDELRQRARLEGPRLAKERFDARAACALLVDLYRELAG